MKQKDAIVVNFVVDWRVLVVIGIVSGLLLLAYSVVHAQDGAPVDINEISQQAPAEQPAAADSPADTLPPVQCGDGLLPSVNGECIPIDEIGVPPASPAGASMVSSTSGGGRHFYLTNNSYWPNQALTACAAGYYMASFWEIVDVSNLTYDYDHPAAYTKADSGFGPPSSWYGWVHTGQDSAGTNIAGMGNCLNWTDATNSNFGVAVRLTRTWEIPTNEIGPWDATVFGCATSAPVWCVKN